MRKILIAGVALLLMLFACSVSFAEHPDNDVQEPDPELQQDPVCDLINEGNGYISIDEEFWICFHDYGVPEVPGSDGSYWEPQPDDYGPLGGDVEWSKAWSKPMSGVAMRLESRTEWVNPTGAGQCPNVAGGCKLKTGADINLVNANHTPHVVDRTWLNHATQVYVWDTTLNPAAWRLMADTGWMAATSTAPRSKMTFTYDWGTAPAGAAWYFSRGWARTWTGTAWTPQQYTTTNMVWDDKPGDNTAKPSKPNKLPKVKAPKKSGKVAVVEPETVSP